MNKTAQKYKFSDFTLENYKKILQIAKEKHQFIGFHQINESKAKSVVWRHDVEFSVPIALIMAKIEHELGIKSTWFFQVHGDFYNLLEKSTYDAVMQIHSLGHEIGLHFDPHFWEIEKEKDLNNCLALDKTIFETYYSISPKAFSFHNTNDFILTCEKEEYAGMLNVYSKQIKTFCGYCTDSTGYWRYEILQDRLRQAKDQTLQVLIHDGMWQNQVLPPRRRIYKVIEDHAAFMKRSYDNTLKKFGAKNIDWDGEV